MGILRVKSNFEIDCGFCAPDGRAKPAVVISATDLHHENCWQFFEEFPNPETSRVIEKTLDLPHSVPQPTPGIAPEISLDVRELRTHASCSTLLEIERSSTHNPYSLT
jgi:hypothetical protein